MGRRSNNYARRRALGLCACCGVKSAQYRCNECRQRRNLKRAGVPVEPKKPRVRVEVDEAEFLAACTDGDYTRNGLMVLFGISKNRVNRLIEALDLDQFVRYQSYSVSKGSQAFELPEPDKMPTPTGTLPGSKEKVEILRKRVEAGEHLFLPLDADYQGYRPAFEKFRFAPEEQRSA